MLGTSQDNPDNTVLSWIDGQNSYVPPNIDKFFERAFLELNLRNPETLSKLGFLEQAGIKNQNGYLQESPSDHHEKVLKLSNEYMLSALEENRWENLSSEQELSRKILIWRVENSNRDFRDHIFPISLTFNSDLKQFVVLMIGNPVVGSIPDVDLYIHRLQSYKMKFELIACDIRKKREIGVMVSKVCLENIVSVIQELIENLNTENNNLVLAVKDKYKKASNVDLPEDKIEQIRSTIKKYVLPGFEEILDEVKICIPYSSDTAGIWGLPRGDEFYKHILKWRTSTDYTPEELHQIGLDNVKKLLEGVQAVVKQLNEKGDTIFNDENSPEENLRILSVDEKFHYEDNEKGREECIKDYERLLDEVTDKVKHLFNMVPPNRCIIQPMPKEMGGSLGAAGIYYEGSLDLTRPGMFLANLCNLKRHNKSGMKTLTAHEAVPGHHYQVNMNLYSIIYLYTKLYYTELNCVFRVNLSNTIGSNLHLFPIGSTDFLSVSEIMIS